MKLTLPITKASGNTKTNSPRSAQLRERRSSSSQAREHAAARHATNPVARRSVPVTPGFRAQPLMQRTASKAKRKYSIALGADGAQLVLPALPIVRPGWQTLSALLVLAFLGAILFVTSSDTFRIDEIKVEGAQRIQPADLMASLDIDGDSVFSLDTNQLTTRLREDFPEFSAIQLAVGLPNQVSVQVTERQPFFEWKYEDITLWVDLEGAVFLPRGVATAAVTVTANVPPPMLPLAGAPVESEDEEPASISEQLNTALVKPVESYDPAVRRADMDVMMASAHLTLRKPEGAALVYDGYEGFGWHDERGWDVYFGTELDELDLKLEMYQAIIGQLAQQNIQPYLISVAHIHAPFYRAHDTGSVEQ